MVIHFFSDDSLFRIGHLLCSAVDDFLRLNGSEVTVDLKWPNDVLVDNKKVTPPLASSYLLAASGVWSAH
jgi:hypothetical protein